MNLHRTTLSALFTHKNTLETIIPTVSVFFVGGSIRDLLLGKTANPLDIDATCTGHPDRIWELIEKNCSESIDRFKTEKFGTMSLILPEEKSDKITTTPLTIEITPFRTEGTYNDLRHPDQLDRSDSLVADSNRRDFTINCLYWIGYTHDRKTTSGLHTPTVEKAQKQYKNQPYLIDNCLVITDHTQIESIYANDLIQAERVAAILDKAVIVGKSATSGQQLSIICDPHGGIKDLLSGTIQTVGQPADRFTEDALRILRGARFAISLNERLDQNDEQQSGFDFRRTVRDAMKEHVGLIESLSFERIQQELAKIFKGTNPYGYIALLNELGALEHIFPALAATKGNHQPTRHHGFDTYSHTLLTLHALQQMPHADRLMKLAMLYHDTGKPEQFAFIEQAIKENPSDPIRSGYEHHAEISVRHAQNDLHRLCFSKKDIKTICRYIKRHHRPGEILDGKKENIDKKLRALISDSDETMTLNLIDIAIADRRGQLNPIQPPAVGPLLALKDRVRELFAQEGRFTQKELCINGNRLITNVGLTPGPELGLVLSKTFNRVLIDVPERNTIKSVTGYLKGLGYSIEK